MRTEAKNSRIQLVICQVRASGKFSRSLLLDLFCAVWQQTCSSRGCAAAGVPFLPSGKEVDHLKLLAIR